MTYQHTQHLPHCVAATGDRCGEGVVWHPGHEAVYWTDINRFLLHRFLPRDGTVRTWWFDEPVTAVTLTSSDEALLVVTGSGAMLWHPASDTRETPFFRLRGWPEVRCNDARIDPRGVLWVGTMRNNVHPDGSPSKAGGTEGVLLSVTADGASVVWQDQVGIGNTLVWDPSSTHLYFGDSLSNTIWRHDYDPLSGSIHGQRDFFHGFARGLPDGSAIDCDGFLWNCRYGGSCIVRISPEGGVDSVIELPVENPTTCVFGGPRRNTLYITSAALDGSPADRLGGCLFALPTNTQGLPENRFLLP